MPVISDLNIVHLPLDPMLVALVGGNHIHQNLQLSLPADGKFFRTRGRSQLVPAAGGEWAGHRAPATDQLIYANVIRSTDILSQTIQLTIQLEGRQGIIPPHHLVSGNDKIEARGNSNLRPFCKKIL